MQRRALIDDDYEYTVSFQLQRQMRSQQTEIDLNWRRQKSKIEMKNGNDSNE